MINRPDGDGTSTDAVLPSAIEPVCRMSITDLVCSVNTLPVRICPQASNCNNMLDLGRPLIYHRLSEGKGMMSSHLYRATINNDSKGGFWMPYIFMG